MEDFCFRIVGDLYHGTIFFLIALPGCSCRQAATKATCFLDEQTTRAAETALAECAIFDNTATVS